MSNVIPRSAATRNLQLLFFALVVIPSVSTDLQAQTARPAPTTGKEVVARHEAATGNLRGKHARTVMTMAMPHGIETRMEMFVSPSGLILQKTTMPGMGTFHAGFDGTTAWSMSDATGPIILPPEQAKMLGTNANPGQAPDADVPLTLRGEMQLDGRRVWIVDAAGVGPDSVKVTRYYDDESGLMVAMDAGNYRVPEKPMMSFRDYRRFGGVLMSALMVVRTPTGDSLISRVVEFDQKPIPDSLFALPASVKALVAKQPGGQ